jgi:predicted nucleotidyltransferase
MRTCKGKIAELASLPFRQKGIQEAIANICRENDIIRLAIFGSFAKNNPTPKSDVDVLITFRKGTAKTLFDLVTIEAQLKKVLKRKIDLVTPEGLSPLLKEEILSNCRVIYAE